ncbi:MAG: hypothetical protein WCK47_07010 [bacterium]|nr:hypothetical protein [Candidatus Sumerlaeota bacterium]
MKNTPAHDVSGKKPRRSRKTVRNAPGIERILVGVRIELRLVKVMKGLAELKDYTLGQFIEEIVMSAMDGESNFADKNGRVSPETRQRILNLKQVYGVNYDIDDLLPNRSSRYAIDE